MCVAGVICEIGEGGGGQGGKWKKGDKVGGDSSPQSLSSCSSWWASRCIALMRNGGLGEFAVVDVDSLVKLDESLDPAEACLLLFNCSKLAASYRNNVYNKEDLVVIHGEGFVLSLFLSISSLRTPSLTLLALIFDIWIEVTLVSLSTYIRNFSITTNFVSAHPIRNRLPPITVFKRNNSSSLAKMISVNLYARWVLLVLSSVSFELSFSSSVLRSLADSSSLPSQQVSTLLRNTSKISSVDAKMMLVSFFSFPVNALFTFPLVRFLLTLSFSLSHWLTRFLSLDQVNLFNVESVSMVHLTLLLK